MSKVKRHRVKQEKAASSSSNTRPPEEHDLAYFIHDRVELMHQVFSVLKSKELKQLAPECVRQLSTDDLQELCLEELLGISSKRLCAILDGAEPPSDTESSSQSPEHLETISLDSISSDDEILSQGTGKKKKHKHRHGKKKRKKRGDSAEAGESRASRAGLTVLELLELQARARAIRAQLHQEHKAPSVPPREASSENEVEIKEEPAEVVEISSDEDKPDVARLQELATSTSNSNETTNKQDEPQIVTKRINDLIITVPQSKPTRRIKLRRQKPTENVAKETNTKVVEKEPDNTEVIIVKSNDTEVAKIANSEHKNKSKKNKKKKKKAKDNKGSDEDEITLQLSDTEKMDLLEDLDAKHLDNVSSSDSDSSDDQQNTEKSSDDIRTQEDIKQPDKKHVEMNDSNTNNNDAAISITKDNKDENTEETNKFLVESNTIKGYVSNDNGGTVEINDLPIVVDKSIESNDNVTNSNGDNPNGNAKQIEVNEKGDLPDKSLANDESNGHEKENEEKSDGEISDRESSEVEVSEVQAEVVCISEEENKIKKKKKKEKKSKKDKSKSGFRESKNENFYKDDKVEDSNNAIEITIDDDDDVYEILEISDDSSCYEVEGVSVLSKEPTAEEIEAFSARMDEIEIDSDDRVITNEKEEVSETTDVENVSWKDRYLGSKKVKRVLRTSNILNAIRKKNIELKKKLEESKKAENIEKGNEQNKIEEDNEEEQKSTVEDGSVEQYETLQGSTKYVDPVKEKEVNDNENEKDGGEEVEGNETVTKEMKKDAKMLLKMYKRLLKYNDVSKQKDPSKKKKKKQKKSKDKEKVNAV